MVVPPSMGPASGPAPPPAMPTGYMSPSTMAGPSTVPGAPKMPPKMVTPSAPGTLNGPPSGNNHAIPLSARRAEPLDMSTVERRGQPRLRKYQPRTTSRMFDIPDAPIYRPTEEEFRDPMEYMRKIAPEGSKYGIVKIIPPDTWNPPFAINTERFHFRTRRQELNSVEGGNRVNNDYLDQLAKFHKQHGQNLNRFPSVDKRPLDLYRLKKTVERKGGFEHVCKAKRWAEVGRDLGYSGKIMSSLSTSLKNSYQKWLLPYEEYLRVAKPGVQHQMEMLNGGPYTPSPGPSPIKRAPGSGPQEHAPTLQASAALNASLNGHAQSPLQVQPPLPPQNAAPQPPPYIPQPPSTGGFTAVNAGGFTPVNAPIPPPAFTAVNAANGYHQPSNSTPQQPHNSIETPSPSQFGSQFIMPHPNGVAALKRQHSELTPDEVDMISRRSKRLRKDVPTVAGSNMHHSRMSSARLQAVRDRVDFKSGEMCETCGKSEEPQKQLRCETCDCVYHMACLDPPRIMAPEHEWHCPRCLVGTNEYGFEEGDVYSLAGFQRRAIEFKNFHFSNIPRQFNPINENKLTLEEDDIEREFWRLVDDLSDATEVEYGADIHSTTHGSGFPTIEKHPRDPYSVDGWNLNILPLDKESLFRHIKSDVSGMTVPWLYVGMIFSTFCWHNEDHYTYSANYQHFGDTKTWYGIPGEDSHKFEQALKDDMPELFETQPDLLFQLVTLAKPDKLRRAGVRVYAIDQHAGEFVITYPRAYHAGFNHGFNFNEAVNFAPQDWEPFGEEGVKRLRDYRKQPCFSHDELLLTAASRDNNIRTAKWLGPALERMRDDELEARSQFLGATQDGPGTVAADIYQGPRYQGTAEIIDPTTEEDEVICTFCKSYCYLSRYVCKNSGKVLCLLHAGSYECCEAPPTERHTGQNSDHVLYYRMTDEAMKTTVRKVVDKANIPENWAAKVDAELDENPRPSLKHLRTLLTEGEKIQYELPQLPELRRFVERCNEWVEDATGFITRKQTNRRKSEKTWRKGSAKAAAEAEEREKELRSVDKIRTLLTSADKPSFDCPEINTLRERLESIEEFQKDASVALADIHAKTTADFEELAERGRDFHVDIPEIETLEKVLKRLRWNDLGKAKRPDPETQRQDQTLEDIEKFLAQGEELNVPDTNPDMIFFKEHLNHGQMWETKAKELIAPEQVNYQQLDAISRSAASVPVTTETLAQVDAILKKQREVQEKIESLVKRSQDTEFRNRPHYSEMKEVMDALEKLQSKPPGTIDLEKEQKKHEDWMRKGKKLFGKANAPLHILHQHMKIVEKRNESCFDTDDKPRGPVEPSSRAATPEDGNDHVLRTEGSSSSRDVFCICRKSEAGMMIECELCHEWYHGKCLKIARGKVKEDDKYTCPICDWRVKIPRDAARPKLEDLQSWLDELETLPFQPDEETTLTNICSHGQAFRDYVRPYVEPQMPATADEVGMMRFYLRKIEGADIFLSDETYYLRRELHKFAPVAPIPPPAQDASGSTRKPRPTKQQKLMAAMGITNPDDLPKELKMKPHIAKRKQSSMGGAPADGSSASPTGSMTPGPGGSGQPYPTTGTRAKHLTPLALQVLGKAAGAPIVDEFLASEPHANRDRLMKVLAVVQMNDPAYMCDLETFKTRVNAVPTPASHNYVPAAFQAASSSPSVFSSAPNDPYVPATSGPSRLASPAQFAYPPPGRSPPASQFGAHMFETTAGSMYDTPPDARAEDRNSNIDGVAGSDFSSRPGGSNNIPSGMPAGMFDSPKQQTTDAANTHGFGTNAGINSPGYGGSQHNMDSVFDELVHDQDEGMGGMDGPPPQEAKYPAPPTWEQIGAQAKPEDTQMGDVDPALQSEPPSTDQR